MGEVSINVEVREGRGKSYTRKLRAAGRVPAVIYGQGKESVALTLDPIILERTLKTSHAGMNTLIDLEGDASVAGRTVLVKALQREPVRGAILHADLYEVDPHARIHVTVPVRLVGDAPGVLSGGVVEHSLREVELSCLTSAIPDEFIADVSELELGESLHVRDLSLPTDVEMLSDGDLSIVSVVLPKVIEEETPEEDEEALEGAEGEVAEDGEKAEEADAADESASGDKG